jgi:hypothetical protein
MKNKVIIIGGLYANLTKTITRIKIKVSMLIINNLFLQLLISSLHNFARINPVGKPASNSNK